jgi:hypothetical protein
MMRRAGRAFRPALVMEDVFRQRVIRHMVEQLRDWAKWLGSSHDPGVVLGVIAAMEEAAAALEARATPMGRIVVAVAGGVVQSVLGVPECCVVEIRDYDVEGCSKDELEALPQDEEGLEYALTEWTADDAAAWYGGGDTHDRPTR